MSGPRVDKRDQAAGAAFYDQLWSGSWRSLPGTSPLSAARQRLIGRELERLDALRSGTRVLDVGCGDGTNLAAFGARWPTVSFEGVDFSAAARDAAPASVRDSIHVVPLDELTQHVGGRIYDAALCSEVLEHVDEPSAILRGITSVVRPGGAVVITVPAHQRYWSALDESAGHLRRFDPSELEQQMRASGMHDVRAYTWGALFGRIYYRLVRAAGPKTASGVAQSGTGAALALGLAALMRVDDRLSTRNSFQLIATGRVS